MTCIVGLVDNGTVYIGADSAGCAGSDLSVRADRKVFISGAFIYGFTSSFRMGQLIQYVFEPPLTDQTDVMKYMVSQYIPALRQCFRDGGYSRRINEEDTGGTFLVGHKGRLFEIESDFQVAENQAGFAAIGSGYGPAIGALFSTKRIESPTERLLVALSAAQEFTSTVRAPFYTLHGGAL